MSGQYEEPETSALLAQYVGNDVDRQITCKYAILQS